MPDDKKILLNTWRFYVEEVEQPTRSGGTHKRSIVRHPGAVVVLPLLTDGRVCLIRNYRIAVAATLVELPAGTLEPNEDPKVTAERELIEETGYRCEAIEHVLTFFTSPGICDEAMHFYVATGCTPGEAEREEGELIENLVVTWQQCMHMVEQGEIRDGKSLAALLLYDRLRQSRSAASP